MRRERLDNLEIRVAHLERKEMRFDYGYFSMTRYNGWTDEEVLQRKHFKAFKKGLIKLLVALDDIADGEYGIEDLGMGDGFLSRVERNIERYYKKAFQKLLSSTGLPKEEATIENYFLGYNTILNRLSYPENSMGGIISLALKEIFKRHYMPDDNKQVIFEIASDLLGFKVRP